MTPVRAVFFDLDGTLIDDDTASRICLERTCLEFQACAPGFDHVRAAHTYFDLGKAFWAHRSSTGFDDEMRDYRTALWDKTLRTFGISSTALARDFALFYGEQKANTAIAFDDAMLVLEALRAQDYRLAVITNGPGDLQRGKLAMAGLDSYFDAVIASTDHNAGKPNRVVFEAALKATGAPPTTTWHVGDNLSTDVGGAINAGIKAAWLNTHGETPLAELPVPDAEIASLTELLPLLGLEGRSNG